MVNISTSRGGALIAKPGLNMRDCCPPVQVGGRVSGHTSTLGKDRLMRQALNFLLITLLLATSAPMAHA